jgi:hypothetical protein
MTTRTATKLLLFRLSACSLVVLAGVVLSTCGQTTQSTQSSAAGGGWYEFQGTWIAAGSRNTLRLGPDRRASIANYDGSLVLAGPSRPIAGFRAEAIIFNDSKTGIVGRAVWTDDRGNQVFSELQGSGSSANNGFVGTFVGGTGRYAGASGGYKFSWRFLIETEDGTVQGQSTGFDGRIRLESPAATSDAGGLRS